MAEPFSIAAGAIGLLDVCAKVATYLSNVKKAARNIESDLNGLQEKINAIIDTYSLIQQVRTKISKTISSSGLDQDIESEVSNIWERIDANANNCIRIIEQFRDEVKNIMGKSQEPRPAGKTDGIRKTVRLQSSYPQLSRFHESLSTFHGASQLSLQALELLYNIQANDSQSRKGDETLRRLDDLGKLILKTQPTDDSREILKTIKAAAATSSKRLNKHFDIPRPVASIWVGRENLLEELQKSLEDDKSLKSDAVQKRFVVQGLGGSGKTEFCCRFAQLNRQKFWGVFSVNANSLETAKESFARIAGIGGVERNDRAAKSWLGELESPWLLIIDNADDPKMKIEELFPPGERGFILVTTRVPQNTAHGTVGRKSFVFEKLEEDDATRLFLMSADIKTPCDKETKDGAGMIAKALGYLPLALILAGSAIRAGYCKVDGFIDLLTNTWNDIRRRQPRARDRRHSDSDDNANGERYMAVYSTYEILYKKLELEGSEDSLDLLRIFSFFNRENIRLDHLMAAARSSLPNPVREYDGPKPLIQRLRELTLKEWIFALRVELLKDRSPAVLPQILRKVADGSIDLSQFEVRLRLALGVLRQYSLITLGESTDSYSIHPLVHVWVRMRPQMSLGDQAIWAQAAKNTISYSISLPLAGIPSKEDLEFHRSLLLHVMNLRERQNEIRAEIQKNQLKLGWMRPVITPKSDLEVVDRNQALQCAKLSYVYYICGKWDEALALQQAVKEFLVPNLGWEHEHSIRICTFLADTYLLKGRFNDAGALIEQALQAAINSLKEEHEKTLEIMDKLGNIRTLQGRLQEAEVIYSRAIKGMSNRHGPNDPVTLCSIDNLGMVFRQKFEYNKALEKHLEALKGMENSPTLGPRHERTLTAKENIAMASCELGGEGLVEAHKFMEEVVEVRTEILGREQPFTLLAQSNLAYVKHMMGDYENAEHMLKKGLVVAERNLGNDHHGVLAARLRLARVLTARKQWEEAKSHFDFLLDLTKYANSERTDGAIKGYHTSWVFALYHYVLFWESQGKVKEALAQCDTLCEVLKTSEHRIRKIVYDKREGLSKKVRINNSFPQHA